jgi:hypothetical protein
MLRYRGRKTDPQPPNPTYFYICLDSIYNAYYEYALIIEYTLNVADLC